MCGTGWRRWKVRTGRGVSDLVLGFLLSPFERGVSDLPRRLRIKFEGTIYRVMASASPSPTGRRTSADHGTDRAGNRKPSLTPRPLRKPSLTPRPLQSAVDSRCRGLWHYRCGPNGLQSVEHIFLLAPKSRPIVRRFRQGEGLPARGIRQRGNVREACATIT